MTIRKIFAIWTISVPLAAACNPADAVGGDDDAYHVVALPTTPDDVDRTTDTVHAIRCDGAGRCAIGTRNPEGGALFVTADGAALDVVLTSAEIEAASDLVGHTQVLAIDDTGAGWIARLDVATRLVMSAGDPVVAASWSMIEPGTNESDMDFDTLNNQELVRAGANGDWLYAYTGVIWHADRAPDATTAWTGRWSPGRVPPFPNNYDELKADDPTLCDSDPSPAFADGSQFGYASPDLSFVMYPAGVVSSGATDPAGLCVSHDGGASFHQVAFTDLEASQTGPVAVTCLDPDRCWALGGLEFDSAPAYVYHSTNASDTSPVWQRATVPPEGDRPDQPQAIAMAPDGQHGWVVGDRGLAWSTTDGGATWTDAAGELAAATGHDDIKWASVFVDADQLWVGGDRGTLLVRD